MKFNMFLLLFVFTIFTACETDDDNGNANFEPSSESFVGVYNTTELSSTGEESFTSNGETTTFVFTEVGSDFDLVWAFNADATYSIVGSYTSTFTETENGEVDTETEVIEVDQTGTYFLNATGDMLSLTSDGENNTFEINAFTESVVELGFTETEEDDDFNATSSLSVRLERQ